MTRPTGAAISGNGSTPPASRVGVALVRDRLAAELDWLRLVLAEEVERFRSGRHRTPEAFLGFTIDDAEVDRLLLHLQFQDRVSQIISVVDTDISRLQATLSSGQTLPAPEAWLSDLSAHYTTQEQREMNGGKATASGGQDAGGSSVEFF